MKRGEIATKRHKSLKMVFFVSLCAFLRPVPLIPPRSTGQAGTACTTPRDYIKFQRALLGGGEVDGVRIL